MQTGILSILMFANVSACSVATDDVSTKTDLKSYTNCTIVNADDKNFNGCALPIGEVAAFLNTQEDTQFSYAEQKGAQAILCFTNDLTPKETDLKILLAGLPVIKSRSKSLPDLKDTVLVFEIVSGQLRVRTISGELSDTDKLQDAINRLQLILQDKT